MPVNAFSLVGFMDDQTSLAYLPNQKAIFRLPLPASWQDN
jgi:hypothetical protein